jgi:hypothetical protein
MIRYICAICLSFIALATDLEATECAIRADLRVMKEYGDPERMMETDDINLMLYMAGFMNGLYLSPFFGVPEECTHFLRVCTRDKSPTQLAAVTKKYIRSHPELWHRGASIVTLLAILNFCTGLAREAGR